MSLFDIIRKRSNSHSNQPELADNPNILGKYYRLEDIKSKNLGTIYLAGMDAQSLFGDYSMDALMLSTLGNTKRVRQYLPGMDLSSEQSAKEYIKKLVFRTELGYEFAYAIRQGNGLLGAINVQTPDYNMSLSKFPHWTLTFFVFELFENKGIMTIALSWILYFLKTSLNVHQIYATVDPNNIQSISVLNKLPFDEVPHDGEGRFVLMNDGQRGKLFMCDLDFVKFNFE